jgi:hypothetical protein
MSSLEYRMCKRGLSTGNPGFRTDESNFSTGRLYLGRCCGVCVNGVRTRRGKIACPHNAMPDCRKAHDARLCCRGFSRVELGPMTRYEQAKWKADRACQRYSAGNHWFKRLYWKWVFHYWETKLRNMPLYEALTRVRQKY